MRVRTLAYWSSLICSALLVLTGCTEALNSEEGSTTEERKQAHGDDGGGGSIGPQTKLELSQAREGTAEYKDFSKGTEDYQKFSVDVPNMGTHYVKKSLIDESTKTMDFSRPFALGSEEHRKNPGIILYNDDGNSAGTNQLVAVEYIVPISQSPPKDLFSGHADDHAWHVHPSVHELAEPAHSKFSSIEGACHYGSGAELYFAVTSDGDKVLAAPPFGDVIPGSSWTSVDPSECLPKGPFGSPLTIVHGQLWTLHAWIWKDNPDGVFAPTNPTLE